MTKEERVRKVWELLLEAQHIDSEEYLRAMNEQAMRIGAAKEREAIERVVGVAMLGADHELFKQVRKAIRARK